LRDTPLDEGAAAMKWLRDTPEDEGAAAMKWLRDTPEDVTSVASVERWRERNPASEAAAASEAALVQSYEEWRLPQRPFNHQGETEHAYYDRIREEVRAYGLTEDGMRLERERQARIYSEYLPDRDHIHGGGPDPDSRAAYAAGLAASEARAAVQDGQVGGIKKTKKRKTKKRKTKKSRRKSSKKTKKRKTKKNRRKSSWRTK